jgi:hypothetical protein
VGLVALAAWEHAEFSAGFSTAVLDGVRAAAATGALFFACGYAPARLLAPAALRPYTALLALALGAVTSSVTLAALGLLHVPFGVSLPAVAAAGIASALAVRVRQGPARANGRFAERLGWPLLLGLVIAAVALSPVWRTGFGTVVGQNGDVVLAVGSAELVKHAPPTAVRPELPIDRIPLVWRSKYPIFYALAAVSSLSGLSVIAAFPFLAAAMLALAAFGFYLLARVGLRAPPAAGLAGMAAVGLSRLPIHVADHPFYNQLWALFALPFILVAGIAFVREPGARAFLALMAFGAIGAFAYPLMLPFPLLFLAVAAWQARSRWDLSAAARRLRARRPAWLIALGGLAGVALLAVLVRGVVEKSASAVVALSPWGDLSAWSGLMPHMPFHRAFGLLDPGGAAFVGIELALVLAAAAYALWRAPRDAGVPLAVTAAAGLAASVYFLHRSQAELFYFKTVGFVGPLVELLAVLGLVELVRRRRPAALAAGAAAVLAAFAVAIALNTRRELLGTNDYASRNVLALRDWSRALPPGATIRIDVPPSGHQLWADYMLSDRRVCALRPLVGFFPYAPYGRRATYALTLNPQPRPRDAVGPPLRAGPQFQLWRLRPNLPGPDNCSHRMVDSITSVIVA